MELNDPKFGAYTFNFENIRKKYNNNLFFPFFFVF